MITKICTICDVEYQATTEYFFKERRGKYGLRSKCKKCFCIESRLSENKPKNKERARVTSKAHYAKNKKHHAEKCQEYYKANSDHLKAKAREYAKNNRDKLRILDTKRREDPAFRISSNMSRSIRQSLFRFNSKGGAPWESLVDFTKQELVEHLKSKFESGMTMENYGEWHIDHLIPIKAHNFTKTNHEDFKRCWSLKNLQPMWAKENMSKSAKLEKHFQPRLQMGAA